MSLRGKGGWVIVSVVRSNMSSTASEDCCAKTRVGLGELLSIVSNLSVQWLVISHGSDLVAYCIVENSFYQVSLSSVLSL